MKIIREQKKNIKKAIKLKQSQKKTKDDADSSKRSSRIMADEMSKSELRGPYNDEILKNDLMGGENSKTQRLNIPSGHKRLNQLVSKFSSSKISSSRLSPHESVKQEEEDFRDYLYSGEHILREIAIIEQSEAKSTKLLELVILIRTLIILSLLFLDVDKIKHLNGTDIFVVIVMMFLNFTIHYFNIKFAFTGIVDFSRKLFFQKVMGLLIDPNRSINNPDYYKLIPTLNVVDPDNLRRWLFLRRASLDLGKKFTYRVFLYCSSFLALYGLMALFFTLASIGLIDYEIPLRVTLLGWFDVITILGIIIKMLHIGAYVNEEFSVHKGKLLNLKHHFLMIKTRYESITTKRKYNCQCLKSIIRTLIKMDLSDAEREDLMENCISMIDFDIEMLDHDFENNSLKLLGLTCSFELMNSIYTGLLSFGLAVGQYFFSNSLG